MFNLPISISHNLQATVADFIIDGNWCIPLCVQDSFPGINLLVQQVSIPVGEVEDKIVWKNSANGELSFKDAYLFKSPNAQNVKWSKFIWNKDIPPTKSLICWRLMHQRLPTDENLMIRGCSLASICSNCNMEAENSFHVFFECLFAKQFWNWLAGILNIPFQISNVEDVWKLCSRSWSPQCKVVVQACIVNIISAIWFRRNQARFQDKLIHWKIILNNVISSVNISGCNTSKTSSPDMREFQIMKYFKVQIHPPKAPQIKEVIWSPPIFNWIKINTDGAATKNPSNASAGGIFRDKEGICIGCFAQNLGNVNAYHAELMAAIIAMETAEKRSFNYLWLETDSQLVYLALKSSSIIPWPLRNRWHNCMNYVRSISFTFSHVYREGNSCADGMANLGLSLPYNFLAWYSSIPEVIRGEYNMNRLGLPKFRFVNF